MAIIVPAALAVAGMAASARQQKNSQTAAQGQAAQGSADANRQAMRDAAGALGGTAGKTAQGMNRSTPGMLSPESDITDRVVGGRTQMPMQKLPSISDAPAPGAGLRNEFAAPREAAGANGLPNPSAENPALAGRSFQDAMGPKQPWLDDMAPRVDTTQAPTKTGTGFDASAAAGYAEQGAKLGMAMAPRPPSPVGIPNLGPTPKGIAGDFMSAMGQRRPIGRF